jgi:hypothetical protein
VAKSRSVWNIHELRGYTDGPPVWISVLWQAYYVFLALAACQRPPRARARFSRRIRQASRFPRLLLLGVAGLLPSFVLLGLSAADHPAPTAWLALGSVLVVSLVIVRIWDLLTLMRAQAGLLAALVRSDPLTGAANHRHQAGDELLKPATAAWHEALEGAGFLARWGGEEFTVLLPSADPAAALRRLDGLRGVIPHGQTCSIGVARWDGHEDQLTLLHRADEALYAAKSGGRDRLVTADDRPV